MTPHPILVVEDDREIRETVLDILEAHGFEPAGAANGEVALKYLRAASTPPCLIILDLMMPVMDGATFRAHQLADPALAQLPVIVVTASTGQQRIQAALAPAALLSKPFKLEDLLAAVHRFC